MTGYGRGEAVRSERRIVVEIKSVNSRYCDLQVRMPYTLSALETRIREMISERLARGKIDVFVTYEDQSEDAVQIRCDYSLAHAYVGIMREISKREGIPDGIDAAQIARFNDVIRTEPAPVPLDSIWELLQQALSDALDALCQMRKQEGMRLTEDIRRRAEVLESHLQKAMERAPMVVDAYRIRLNERIEELLGDQAGEWIGPDRLAAEVALFADKCAIDEELVRLQSHLRQLKNTVILDEPVGKKLDFIIQEMNREVNTIGSKANDLDLTHWVIEMKSEIEKIREQIQNLE